MTDHDQPKPDSHGTVTLRPMPAPFNAPPESRFGDRLKDARLQLDLSVEAFSRLCKTYDKHDGKGISPPTLGRYESNETLPGLRELRLISQALGVPVQWLVDGNLPAVKGQVVIQSMVTAMRDFVEFVNGDIKIGDSRVSDLVGPDGDGWRAQRLAEARKPGGDA